MSAVERVVAALDEARVARLRARTRWRDMKQRCFDPRHKDWKHYGGRGITVCPEWLDFDTYYAAVGDPPAAGLTLDRRDNDRGYEPGNMRWATPLEQTRNRRKPGRDITHCPERHEYTEPNTYLDKRGTRRCRKCHRDKERARWRASKQRAA